MSGHVEAIRILIENAGPDLRRIVQNAISLAVEDGAETELLRAIESRKTVGFRWLRAALTERLNGSEAAQPLWDEVVAQNGCEIPDLLIHRARNLTRLGDSHNAAKLIRLALENSHDYGLYVRAEAMVRKCKEAFGARRWVKVALLSSSTTALLRSILELQFIRDGIEAEIYEPPFGTYVQELMEPSSGLHRFQPDFIVLLLNWRDLGLSSDTSDDSGYGKPLDWIKQLWRVTQETIPGKLIQISFTPPPQDANFALSSLLPQGRIRRIRRINEELFLAASDRIIMIDGERIAAASKGGWEDPLLWSSAKAYPAPEVLPVLGEHIASVIRAEIGLSRKLLVLDADNTLWGGVIGEDGLDGIRLGPPSAIGERYLEFHLYLKELNNRGVLLALASKNNQEDVLSALSRHPSALLHPDDFISCKVNWNEKSTSIRQIASEVRLGLDSFVFMDDNPAERSAVRRELPEVIVPDISGEPSESIAALERGLYFQALRLTQEDKTRNASYRAAAKQAAFVGSVGTVDEYLLSLSMSIEYGFVDAVTITRVTQLINKTNQFNLTTPRYSQAEVQSFMTSPSYWCRWYRLRDRFADHGLIGVLIARLAEKTWTIDTWLMSCRVIGREVESFMFRDLVLSARKSGVTRIIARYCRTTKNSLVAKLLPNFGFTGAEPGDLSLDVPAAQIPDTKFFQSVQNAIQN
jgi:FkbH-like protein